MHELARWAPRSKWHSLCETARLPEWLLLFHTYARFAHLLACTLATLNNTQTNINDFTNLMTSHMSADFTHVQNCTRIHFFFTVDFGRFDMFSRIRHPAWLSACNWFSLHAYRYVRFAKKNKEKIGRKNQLLPHNILWNILVGVLLAHTHLFTVKCHQLWQNYDSRAIFCVRNCCWLFTMQHSR